MKGLMSLLLLPPELSKFENFIPRLKDLLQLALVIAVTFGFVFAVFLGVKLAIAQDQNKRKEAKKHIITFIASMIMVVLLLWLIPILMDWAASMF